MRTINTQQKNIFKLLKSAITGEKYEIGDDFNFEEAIVLCKKHAVLGLLYYGAVNCGMDNSSPLMQELFMFACQNVAVSERQMYELKTVFGAFEAEGIEYMPVKGSLLKALYPKSEMRSMGDADILIKSEQYSQIKPVMEKLGYMEKLESDHEFAWQKKGALFLELHKRLIPSYNKDYFAYYGDGWKLGVKTETSRYEMSDEDHFIYIFTHFAKHFRDAGIGIRHFVDLYVYLNAKPDLDKTYIENEFNKLQLLEFYNNCIKTLDVCFGNADADAVTDYIVEKIFGSGPYGTAKSDALYKALVEAKSGKKESVRAKTLLGMIFQPLRFMKERYPILKKFPFLLPAMWVVRWFEAIFFRRNNIKSQSERLKVISSDNISNYEKELDLIGLNFNFKE